MCLSLYSIKYAQSVLPESLVFDGGNKSKTIPISFAIYLVKTKGKNILVDAGCDTMPMFDMKQFYSPAFALRQVGISADEITDLIITHAHHDHIDAVRHFKNATIHICEEEYAKGQKYIPKDMTVNLFKEDFALAPSIKIVKWGGHSSGSSIVEITTNEVIHIIAGDECYTHKNITDKICTGSYYNKEKATEFVHKFSHRKYRVHTCHDISIKTERII